MNSRTFIPVLVLFVFFLSITQSFSQETNILKDSLYSSILKEQRNIQVVLPIGYKQGDTTKYDVIYVLDGDNTKKLTYLQRDFLSEFIPSVILIGINNIDRNRDFLPTFSKEIKTSGGAENFSNFLHKELMPYVSKKYPSSGEATLFGHSFGGLFATYDYLKNPSGFNNYLIVDPSFWWDNRYMIKMTHQKLDSLPDKTTSVFITGRQGKAYIEMGIKQMDSVFQLRKFKNTQIKSVAYPNETHGSVVLKSFYDGMKFFYDGVNSSYEFHPMAGTIIKGKPIKVWFFSDKENVYYTTNGSVPDKNSLPIQQEIEILSPARLMIKSASPKCKPVTANFVAGNFLKPITKPKKAKEGGFSYSLYEGNWDKLPDFNKLKAVKTGIANKDFNLEKLTLKIHFALLIEGFIEIRKEGYYFFGIKSDDGSKFFINNQLILSNDGLHNNEKAVSYILPLTKGFYPIRLEYFQKEGGTAFNLGYVTPETSITDIKDVPFEFQYGKE